MSKKKGPPGYPGDEAISKKFGELMREIRLKKGLLIEEVDAVIDEETEEDRHPLLPRALSLVTRELREDRKMSRAELSDISGLPLRFINRLERARLRNMTLPQLVRIAMALNHPVADFVVQIYKLAERLRAN